MAMKRKEGEALQTETQDFVISPQSPHYRQRSDALGAIITAVRFNENGPKGL